MEEVTDTIGANDSGRYDNDFEKLPRDEEEVQPTTEPVAELAEQGSPGGDAKNIKSETVFDEPPPSATKSQLNIEEVPDEKPSAETSGVKGSEGAVCTGCCFVSKTIDPRVKDLLLWRDVKTSGIIFGSSLVVFLSLALFSVISVISYLSLAVLTMTASFRIYYHVMAALKKTEAVNPFRKYLDVDIKFPEDMAHRYGDIIAKHVTKAMDYLRRVFFVDTIIDTLKFALVLWVLTYIGGWFNGMTLLIIADILLFTVPKIYVMNQSKIDEVAKVACVKVQGVWKQIQEKIPLLGKSKQE